MSATAAAPAERKNLLIVDDEERFVMSLAEGLKEDLRLSIHVAGDGRAALAALQAQPMDLVITDLRMPGMGGFELITHLSRQPRRVPVIVMTAYGSPEVEANLRLMGVSHFVEKPIDIGVLAAKVGSILAQGEPVHRAVAAPGDATEERLLAVLRDAVVGREGGEVVVRSGQEIGRFYFHEGHLAWVAASTLSRTLLALIVDRAGVSLADLKQVFEECKRAGKNFAETVVEWGLLQPDQMRALLLEQICTACAHVLSWPGHDVMFLPEKRVFRGSLLFDLEEVLAEAHRQRDALFPPPEPEPSAWTVALAVEDAPAVVPVDRSDPAARPQSPPEKGAPSMSHIKTALESLKSLDGFMGAAAFAPSGELIAEAPGSAGNLAELGALANEVLLKSQKTTDIMGVGRGNMLHISAPKANLLVRCLNENTNFAASEPGRAHVHMMVILEPDGNIALGKMRLEKALQEAAADLR